jgi:DNA replication protein DnaC
MKDTIPVIEPIKLKSYESKQSKYSMVASLPMRSVLLGPSGSGKTVLLVSMILDLYRDCFARIYIWSPSVFVDHVGTC